MRELDPDRLPGLMGSMTGLWLILVFSTWVGVVIGAIYITAATLATAPFTLGLAMITMFAVVIATAGAIVAFGFFILPVGATVAAALKLRFEDTFCVGEWALVGLPRDHALTTIVHEQAARLGLPKPPSTMIMPNVVNAFAIRASANVSIVAIGTPLVAALTREETSAILGHELGHIVSGDARRMMFALEFQKFLTWFLVFNGLKKFWRWALTPIGELLIMRLSRHREYWADAIGAALTSKDAMISALRKLQNIPAKHSRKEMLHSEMMFMGVGRWFSTHPTMQQRIRALEAERYIARLPYREISVLNGGEPSSRRDPDFSITAGI